MATLEDILTAVGGMRADVNHLLEAGKRHEDRTDTIAVTVAEIKAKLDSTIETVKDMKPIVEDYQATKNRGIGIFVAVSMIAGVVGEHVVATVKKLL